MADGPPEAKAPAAAAPSPQAAAAAALVENNLGSLTREALSKLSVLAEKHVDASIDECRLLEKMNTLAAAKYGELEDNVKSMEGFFDDMDKKCARDGPNNDNCALVLRMLDCVRNTSLARGNACLVRLRCTCCYMQAKNILTRLHPRRDVCVCPGLPSCYATDDALKPHLKEIEEIDGTVGELEAVVQSLDTYTRSLEQKVKNLR